MKQIPFILLIKIEHDNIFGNESSNTCALDITVGLKCLNSEDKGIYK